jgi:magnesium chelatase family protein
MVGLPDSAVKESRERVSAAIKNSDLPFPNKKITVNLAPADIRKEGCAFDLPIALGIISAMGLLDEQALQESMFVGELALDGSLRSVHGTLSIALMAKELGKKQMLVPYDNAEEAGLVEDILIIPVNSLAQSLRYLKNEEKIDPHKSDITSLFSHKSSSDIDISDIKGQENVKRALEIAAAGGHNIIKI